MNKDLKPPAEEQYPNRGSFLFGEGFASKAKAAAVASRHSKELNRRVFLAAVAQNTSPRVTATSGAYPTHHYKRQFSNVSVLQQTTDNSNYNKGSSTRTQSSKTNDFTDVFRSFLACSSVQTTFPPLAQSGSYYTPDGAVASTPSQTFHPSRKDSTSQNSLAEGNFRCLGTECDHGLSTGIHSSAISVTPTSDHGSRLNSTSHLKRGGETVGEGSDNGSQLLQGARVCLNNISSPEERQSDEACNQLEISEPLCKIQDGGDSSGEGRDSTRGLDDSNQHEGCIFCNPNSQGTPEVLEIHMAVKGISVSMPSVRTFLSTQSIYKDIASSHRLPEE